MSKPDLGVQTNPEPDTTPQKAGSVTRMSVTTASVTGHV